ncbi:hypothetical protein BO83DRAFT_204354 [Aspergillus eucalypticola CBS 122712]|uniref:Uncharacterized protein n=1 Tax=Aspergillus eucalypticola (strain CBS 122712 / IBT 29274) TaxID=1448314 RepID=A0A317W0F9_ASPEC|nr:uncharacterized protein BO83DRAFT_204354 [Aspergillus eucalypticola CBS 122712]PWY80134.1 hypothetical protein BO83DRAFT_204354 [Aspergillus eucalypticola CBS 122712]
MRDMQDRRLNGPHLSCPLLAGASWPTGTNTPSPSQTLGAGRSSSSSGRSPGLSSSSSAPLYPSPSTSPSLVTLPSTNAKFYKPL